MRKSSSSVVRFAGTIYLAVLARPVDTTASHLVFALLIQTIQRQLLRLPLV